MQGPLESAMGSIDAKDFRENFLGSAPAPLRLFELEIRHLDGVCTSPVTRALRLSFFFEALSAASALAFPASSKVRNLSAVRTECGTSRVLSRHYRLGYGTRREMKANLAKFLAHENGGALTKMGAP